jgi:gamma-glutamylputrescine oxidase
MNLLPKDRIYWNLFKKPGISPLKKDLRVDIAIIGGGIAGLSAAQSFEGKGFKVALLEKNFCGAGASGKSSGFITPDSEFGLSEFIARFGKNGAKRLWDFGNFGVELIRKNIRKKRISCDFIEQDALFVSNSQKEVKSTEEEYGARKRLGYESKLYYNVKNILGTSGYYSAARFFNTFVINSYLYCQGLRNVLKSSGAMIFERTSAKKINDGIIETGSGNKVRAKSIIVCTDRFTPELRRKDRDFYHVQTYLMASRPLGYTAMKTIFPEKQMMVWDSDLNYKYFRPIGGNRLLIGGGDVISLYNNKEIHNNKKIFRKLSDYFGKKFPNVKVRWEYMWPGMLGISKDFLPIIANDEKMPNVHYAGAGAGLPWSAAIGSYLCDKIANGRDDYDEFFSYKRNFTPVDMLQPILSKKLAFALSHGYVKFVD